MQLLKIETTEHGYVGMAHSGTLASKFKRGTIGSTKPSFDLTTIFT
jgi:hypothetical protein